MTNPTTPEKSNQDHAQVVQILRDTLTNTLFQNYHELMKYIRSLPISQQSTEIQMACFSIGTGILWLQDLLKTSELIMKKPVAAIPPAQETETIPPTDNA